ncbi:unnamed protein product [Peniophora sp. CBMAI 1063]|nr:unnamed protein product [Peniophora sp. CBMAI 1063]
MTAFNHQHHRWVYVWVPWAGAFVWCAMLVAMIAVYYAEGANPYSWQTSRVPYISDIGASFLQPLFIAGSTITAVCSVAVLIIERLLWPTGMLDAGLRRREKLFSNLAIFGSVVSGLGLILLSCFNDHFFSPEHYSFLGVFLFGVILSSIVITIKYRWLSHSCPDRRLRMAYFIKATITTVLIILAIVYAACYGTASNVAGILEWVLAFGFTFYLLSFAYDLRLLNNGEASDSDLPSGIEKLEADESSSGLTIQHA